MSSQTPALATRRGRTRMTSAERREQLIVVARSLFAERGFDGTSVEEVAARAQVSKPVVYEHFGGKEGLYAVVVDREVTTLDNAIMAAIAVPATSYREVIERGTLALLDYIDASPDGFRIISRDSPVGSASGSFASILNDIATRVEDLLAPPLIRRGYDATIAGVYSQALVGLVASAGLAWLDTRKPDKRRVAAELVNLAWNGLASIEHKPTLITDRGAVPGKRRHTNKLRPARTASKGATAAARKRAAKSSHASSEDDSGPVDRADGQD
ncbi:TetR/AcrR family transcriptional regulator [Propionibacterium freudenreichii]|uniref:TetR/AcrR family transcriptional regulator n=1 Tax=Propionibacterium freudenreichii TaxID=1744 RepID=UPI0005422CE2|nr:TetR/AcrR family transcriptional regulator [Propionibacterium freudenreichii]MDK9643344.1 TetR/AcrR family transcriptional regulator [Propionibacterium freudenreichii]MDK9646518.1 TetR/AcrR family transcriptional regulator [Propionibacterium freudenreichii]MDK9655228.1 TetR/AcrR family transcriptional regulator [Propionibacterium freudenreichii]MDK9666322.1 TetR/AcrR family transcriptional regulator [Propionibacterium freudenreichii]MDK9670576.1 TetR/AcrR family transcriptional regulator [P